MDFIGAFFGFIILVCVCAGFVRLGNCVLELRKLNAQFEEFLKRFEVK